MKKFLLMMTMFLCMSSTVFCADEIYTYNTSWDDNFLGIENIKLIFNTFGYTSYTTSQLNTFYDNFVENYEQLKIIYPDVKLYNLLFFQNSSSINSATLSITVSNGTFGNSSIPYAKLSRASNVTYVNWVQDFNSSGTRVQSFNSATGNLTTNNSLHNTAYTATFDETNDEYILDGNIFSFFRSYTVVYEDKFSFMSKSIPGLLVAENEYLIPEIPEEPEEPDNPSGDTGIGDYTGQLTQIQGSLNNIENKIPTSGEIAEIVPSSGDIEQATQNGVVQGSTEFWGSSGDMNGEQQEDLISDKVDELTEQISGDLAENEIFSILKTYEDKLFGGFTGEQDFKIEWNDISYAGGVIIPKGEVNFSEICRENEALGRVKTTINIILGFLLLFNCVIYLYNLLLATLGIDNPYLYEKPQDITTTSYSVNMNTGKTTETKTTKRRDGITFTTRRDI